MQYGFPLAVLVTVLLWLMLWNVGGRKPAGTVVRSNASVQWNQFKVATKGSGLIMLLAVAALRGMGDRAILLFLPLYLSNVLQFSTAQVGIYLGLLNVLAIVAGPAVGAMSDRIGRKPMIVIAMLVSALFPPFMVLTASSVVLTVSVVLFGVFLYSVNSLAQAAAMDVVEGMKLEGTFIGMLWGNNALFSAVSPIIAGALVGVFGFESAFYYSSILYLIGGLLAVRVTLRRAQRA